MLCLLAETIHYTSSSLPCLLQQLTFEKSISTTMMSSTSPALDHFPIRELPLEVQVKIFRCLIGKPPSETSQEADGRKQARINMLLLDKKAYNDFSDEFYKNALFVFATPSDLIKGPLRDLGTTHLQYVTNLCWRTSINSRRVHENDVDAWVDVILSSAKLPNVPRLDLDMNINTREIRAQDYHVANFNAWDKELLRNVGLGGLWRLERVTNSLNSIPDMRMQERLEMEYKHGEKWLTVGDDWRLPAGVDTIRRQRLVFSVARV